MKLPKLDEKYKYSCKPIEIIDGDTFRAKLSKTIDIGFDCMATISTIQLIRLYGLNSKELYVKDKTTNDYKLALEAKVALSSILINECTVFTFKDKYAGRYDGLVFSNQDFEPNLSEWLLINYPHLYTEYYGKGEKK